MEPLILRGIQQQFPSRTSTVEISNRSQPTLYRLHEDVLQEFMGSVYEEKFDLGFLGLGDLWVLAQTSFKLHSLAQPMLNAVKAWRNSNFIPRLLKGALHPHDLSMFKFFRIGIDSSNSSICRPGMTQMTPADYAVLVDDITRNPILTSDEKGILKGLLPSAEHEDLVIAIKILLKLEHTEQADRLIQSFFARHPDTPLRLQRVGGGYNNPREERRYDRLEYGPHKRIPNLYFQANKFKDLGQHAAAAATYIELGYYQHVTPYDILMAADRLKELGSDYHPKAAELYERCAHRVGATPWNIQCAAQRLKELGSEYPDGSTEHIEYHARADALLIKFGL